MRWLPGLPVAGLLLAVAACSSTAPAGPPATPTSPVPTASVPATGSALFDRILTAVAVRTADLRLREGATFIAPTEPVAEEGLSPRDPCDPREERALELEQAPELTSATRVRADAGGYVLDLSTSAFLYPETPDARAAFDAVRTALASCAAPPTVPGNTNTLSRAPQERRSLLAWAWRFEAFGGAEGPNRTTTYDLRTVGRFVVVIRFRVAGTPEPGTVTREQVLTAVDGRIGAPLGRQLLQPEDSQGA